MSSPPAVLIVCDRDVVFREALCNLLLAAGYDRVDVAATVREGVRKVRGEAYGRILIGLSRPFSRARCLAAVARRRQPATRIIFIVRSDDLPPGGDVSVEYILDEHVFSSLLAVI
jgi:hypothetical protein